MKAIASFLVLCSASVAAWAKDTPADTAQIKRGEYLAIAADCAACHTAVSYTHLRAHETS